LCCVFVLFFFVLCTLCCQFLWIIHVWLSLRYSLTFIYYLQHITQKTKYWTTGTPLKTGVHLRCSGRVNGFCCINGTHRVNLVTNT
jgi:hypothetical protein